MSVRPYTRSCQTGMALLFVKADWCPHCQSTAPEIEEAADILGSVVPVYAVDSEKNRNTVRRLGVEGFPTIMFRDDDGELEVYNGPRQGQNIADWVCAQSGHCGRTGRTW